MAKIVRENEHVGQLKGNTSWANAISTVTYEGFKGISEVERTGK